RCAGCGRGARNETRPRLWPCARSRLPPPGISWWTSRPAGRKMPRIRRAHRPRPAMNALPTWTALLSLLSAGAAPAEPPALFSRGEGISLDRAIPANERGTLALSVEDKGRVYGGTTGRAAHLFVY